MTTTRIPAPPVVATPDCGEIDLERFKNHKKLRSVYDWLAQQDAKSHYGNVVAVGSGVLIFIPNTVSLQIAAGQPKPDSTRGE